MQVFHTPLNRRRMAALLGSGLLAGSARAQEAWPARPVKLVVPYPPGGNADNVARLLATQLSDRLGQQVIIDNRPGAGGTIGAAAVAKAPADGYTLLLDATAFTVNPALFPRLPYDAGKDFAPVSLVIESPLLLVVPTASPFRSVAQLLAAARAQPGKLSYASAGNGGAQHLAGELFKQGAKVFMTHIPYRGGAPALTDLIGGQVDMMFSAVSASAPFVKGGKLRVLAVTSGKRLPAWPEVPTVAESGLPGYSATVWYGVVAPAKTPQPIIDRLYKELNAVLQDEKVRASMAQNDFYAEESNPASFGKFIRAEAQKWGQVVKAAGLKAE